METFDVRLTATALVSALVTVKAESEEDANALAIKTAKEGNVVWNYDGLESDSSIEVSE